MLWGPAPSAVPPAASCLRPPQALDVSTPSRACKYVTLYICYTYILASIYNMAGMVIFWVLQIWGGGGEHRI